MIEEVKAILRRNTVSWYREDQEAWMDIVARQICQLFEPEPDRLLPDEKLESAELAIGQLDPLYEKSIWVLANDEYIKAKRRAIAKAQDVETASIVRKEGAK